MSVYEAKFESKCPACGEVIAEGDEIVADDDGEWVHLECGDD